MFEHAQVTRTDLAGAVVLSPIGEFDLAAADILRASFLQAADADRVVVDLSDTAFMDSTAIGVLVAAARRQTEQGGWVRLVNPRSNVRRILRITEIDRVLGLYDDVDQALAHEAPLSSDSA